MSGKERQTSAQDSTQFLKSVVLFVLVSLAVGLMSVVFVMQSDQSKYHSEFLRLSTEQRLLALSLVNDSLSAAQGRANGFDRLAQARDRFDLIYDSQRFGARGDRFLAVRAPAVDLALDRLGTKWAHVRKQIQTILAGREEIEAEKNLVGRVEELIPAIQILADEVAVNLIEAGAPPNEVYIATRQLLLLQRLENNVSRLLGGGLETASAADRFGRDVALYARVMDAMIEGDAGLGLTRVTDPGTLELLRESAELFDAVEENASLILASSPNLFKVAGATEEIVKASPDLHRMVESLMGTYGNISKPSQRLGWMAGLLAAALLAAVAVWQIFEARVSARESAAQNRTAIEQNQRNQDAILTLLDEMGDLADGDLTVHTTVSEELTGAIADSVNYAVDALRDLVTTINATSEQVAAASVDTSAIAERLASASATQASQIVGATKSADAMVDSMGEMSTSAAASSDVAARSVKTAAQGVDRVRRTIQGMDVIREHIQETSKRIKRLGESSQEIGDIVGLINDIADQTNILALNAAIQAAAAGESGRGFAVVADEVQRLAERAASSTKRIEALVKTIQADTSEAVISMEKSTSEVVNGADLAERAGESLEEIEKISDQLAALINDISVSARQQSDVASGVSATMASINDITRQTSDGARLTARSIGELTKLAEDLRHTVAGFKLPEEAGERA